MKMVCEERSALEVVLTQFEILANVPEAGAIRVELASTDLLIAFEQAFGKRQQERLKAATLVATRPTVQWWVSHGLWPGESDRWTALFRRAQFEANAPSLPTNGYRRPGDGQRGARRS